MPCKDTGIQGRPYDYGGRDWSYAAINQETSLAIGSWKRQERTIHGGQHIDLGLTISNTIRKYIFVILSHLIVVSMIILKKE